MSRRTLLQTLFSTFLLKDLFQPELLSAARLTPSRTSEKLARAVTPRASMVPLALTAAGPLSLAVVFSRTLDAYDLTLAGCLRALEKVGMPPLVSRYSLEGDKQNLPGIVERIRTTQPTLVLTLGTLAARSLAQALPDQPLMFGLVLAPGASGLAEVGKVSGRNLTGVSMDIPPEAQVKVLQQLLPQARRIGILYHPEESAVEVERARQAAQGLGLTLEAMAIQSEREVPRVFTHLCTRVDALLALPDARIYTESTSRYLLLQTLRQSLPFVGLLESFVQAGALAGLGLDYGDLGRQLAEYVLRWRTGEGLATLPVLSPRRTRLLLNLRTARRIGVTFPADVRAQAEVLVP